MRVLKFPCVLCSLSALSPAWAGPPNDTGQSLCYNGAALAACAIANTGDGAAFPRQDGRFGRDARATAGTLVKTGAGAAGFDFTKVCMSGDPAGQGACPANPVAGTNPNEWACTKDNVSNLIWSIETIANVNWTDAAATHPPIYNAANRCGFNTGWRVPAKRELLSIAHLGTSFPSIDASHFPGTVSNMYWAAEPHATDAARAWGVGFAVGGSGTVLKSLTAPVRLVRSGP